MSPGSGTPLYGESDVRAVSVCGRLRPASRSWPLTDRSCKSSSIGYSDVGEQTPDRSEVVADGALDEMVCTGLVELGGDDAASEILVDRNCGVRTVPAISPTEFSRVSSSTAKTWLTKKLAYLGLYGVNEPVGLLDARRLGGDAHVDLPGMSKDSDGRVNASSAIRWPMRSSTLLSPRSPDLEYAIG